MNKNLWNYWSVEDPIHFILKSKGMGHEKKILPKLRRKMDENILCTSSDLRKSKCKDARISPIWEIRQVEIPAADTAWNDADKASSQNKAL